MVEVMTATELRGIAGGENKQSSGNNNIVKDISKVISDFRGMLGDIKGMASLLPKTKEENPQSANIQAKIEKGVDNRIEKMPKPQNKGVPTVAIHVGDGSKDMANFLKLIGNGITDEMTGKEVKKMIEEQAVPKDLEPIVETFLRKHTEVYYEANK